MEFLNIYHLSPCGKLYIAAMKLNKTEAIFVNGPWLRCFCRLNRFKSAGSGLAKKSAGDGEWR